VGLLSDSPQLTKMPTARAKPLTQTEDCLIVQKYERVTARVNG
jgi:hypothetical protein